MWRSLWLVIRHDTGVILRQWSFWIFSLVMPGVLLVGLSADLPSTAGPAAAAPPTPAPAGLPAIGLVDEAGLITRLPPNLPTDWLRRYPDQAAAQTALTAGEVAQVVVVPADYVASGAITVYDQEYQILSSGEAMGVGYGSDQAWVLEALLTYNLTGDAHLPLLLHNPTPGALTRQHMLGSPAATSAAAPLISWLSSLIPFVFYMLLVLSGSYLMRSVVAEKENRIAEVLLLSVNPRDLMLGKLLAVTVVLGVQLAIWAGGAAVVLSRNPGLLPDLWRAFPITFWLWTVLFLVLGYLLFAAVMAAAGALAPNAREGGQVIWLLILPLLPTMMFSSNFIEQPDSALVLFLSLFPFSAPSAMVTRLATGPVPFWQVAASAAGLALTAWLFVGWAGRFFRAEHLLAYAPFNWRRLLTAGQR